MLSTTKSIINHSKYALGQMANFKHTLLYDTNITKHKVLPVISINKNQKLKYSIVQTVKFNNNKDFSKFYFFFFIILNSNKYFKNIYKFIIL